MNENISRLMDGELDDDRVRALRQRAASPTEAMRTWICYHVIGDHLARHRRPLRTLRGALLAPRSPPSPRCSRRRRASAAPRSPPRSRGPWLRRSPPSPSWAGPRSRWWTRRRPRVAKAREAGSVRAGAGDAARRGRRRLPARAPGIFAGVRDPGRQLPARRGDLPGRGPATGAPAVGEPGATESRHDPLTHDDPRTLGDRRARHGVWRRECASRRRLAAAPLAHAEDAAQWLTGSRRRRAR